MNKHNDLIRNAQPGDASRLAEILIFSKRTHYRSIFHDDAFSFGELQVYPTAQAFLDRPETLQGYRVYDDGFVKGLVHTEGDEIIELYVDPFFEGEGIGSALITDALSRILHPRLWVLEKNEAAIRFYRDRGFEMTGERARQGETPEFIVRMEHRGPVKKVIGKIVRVTVDRPAGSRHPEHPDLVYPVNYGYVRGVRGGDGEWQDAYILGITEPLEEFTGLMTAVIRRLDDNEDKWVVIPEGTFTTGAKIREQTFFQEQYFRTLVLM